MKPITEAILSSLLLLACFYVCFLLFEANENYDTKHENLKLDNQIKKYQVGIDSLRYDMELNFYEKRKEKK